MRIRICFALLAVIAAIVFSSPALRAADTLPNQIADDAFWKLIDSSSEDGGVFQSENFLSNETGFEAVIPALQQTTKPGGVYMGVGPEQNFTYITGIRPKIAFIIDIRRQNMLEHMIYKAVFEMSADRADFIARLFSLKRPAGLSEQSTVDELFKAFDSAEPLDNAGFQRNLQDIKDLLVTKHKFGLTAEDQEDIAHVYTIFHNYGPQIDYNSGSFRGGRGGCQQRQDGQSRKRGKCGDSHGVSPPACRVPRLRGALGGRMEYSVKLCHWALLWMLPQHKNVPSGQH